MNVQYFSMKVTMLVLGTTLSLFTFAGSAHSADTNIAEEWQEFVDELAEYSVQQRDQAVDFGKQQLEKMDNNIAALEQDMSTGITGLKQESQQQRKEMLKAIKQNRKDLVTWMEKMKSSGEASWDEITDGFSDAYKKLANSLENARQTLSDGQS